MSNIGFGAVAAVACFVFFWQRNSVEPTASLHTFAAQEEAELANYSDVPLGTHASFHGIGCVKAQTLDEAKRGLEKYLDDVPPNVRTRILEKALPADVAESSSRYESDLTIDGNIVFILAFWHTVATNYEVNSCVSLAGGSAKPADRIIGTSTRKVQRTVGYTECNCKFRQYFCSSCPLVEEEEETVPLSVPVRWSAKQHNDMRRAIQRQSIDMIKSLPTAQIASGASLPTVSQNEENKLAG